MGSEQERKLFVGGIPWKVTEAMLEEHFNQYGEVEECVMVVDRITSQPRGFGFVTFADHMVAMKVLEDNHSIFGKQLVVNPTEPRPDKSQNYRRDHHAQLRRSYHPRKVFVAGLPHNLTNEEFIEYFEKFGGIDEGVIIYDKETNTSRGFGFITFESDEVVEDVMQESFYELKNVMVKVQRARLKVRRNHGRLVNWYDYESVGLQFAFEGALRYDDLAFGVNCIFCYNCGKSYGYGHYSGCLYENDPFKGTWRTVWVPHTYLVARGELDPLMSNGYVPSN